jgi:hypothetical protein
VRRLWKTDRKQTENPDNGAVVEFVPGNRLGERAYFWFGDPKGHCATTIDARALARLVDGVRTRS